jgi:hypothetical protein
MVSDFLLITLAITVLFEFNQILQLRTTLHVNGFIIFCYSLFGLWESGVREMNIFQPLSLLLFDFQNQKNKKVWLD